MKKAVVLFLSMILLTSVLIGQDALHKSAKGLFHQGYVEQHPAIAQPPPAPAPAPPKPLQSEKKSVLVDLSQTHQTQQNMGIRYRIVQLAASCEQLPVGDESTFRAGDQIRISLESNADGYLYILNRGTSGDFHYFFPHPMINGGQNLIKAGVEYTIPPATWLKFDNTPGEEIIYIVISKVKIDPLEGGILEQGKSGTGISPTSRVIKELNQEIKTRGLVYEKDVPPVVQKIPDKQMIQDTYVVNPNDDSYFVSRIVLKHIL